MMVTECPKCQEAISFDLQQLGDHLDVVCESCLTSLKLKIVPEPVTAKEDLFPTENVEPFVEPLIETDQKQSQENVPSESNEKEQPQSPTGPGDKNNVLVCIDGEATQELVQDLLKESGYHMIDIPAEMSALMSSKVEAPEIAIIDAGLNTDEKIDICAEIRKNPSLKDAVIILVGSMFEKNTKYRDHPPSILGANDYIDRYYIQKELLNKIKGNLEEKQNGTVPELNKNSSDTPELPPVEVEKESEAQEEAKRLARIIVSDIFIYNEKQIEEGIRTGKIYELLNEEIEEGQKLYESRISDELRFVTNYFEETLEDAINKKRVENGQEHLDSEEVKESDPIMDPIGEIEIEEEEEEETVIYSPPTSNEAQEEDSKEVKNAKRLARIVVSDVVIYNEKKAEEGVSTGKFYELLEEEIEEGRQLYESRVDQRFLNGKDYLQEAFEDFINKKKASVSTG